MIIIIIFQDKVPSVSQLVGPVDNATNCEIATKLGRNTKTYMSVRYYR